MGPSVVFDNFSKDIETYLKSKLPTETPDNVISEISAFVAYKAAVLVTNMKREKNT